MISALVLSLAACSRSGGLRNPEMCATKYPIVLVHGIGFRDKIGLVKYWGETASYLRGYGATVYLGGGEAFGTVPANAEILKKTLEKICAETGAAKVNIIAHSRGGIESRYLISSLGMADRVASLTTIATPHRGSPMADLLMKRIKPDMLVDEAVNLYARMLGDDNPSSFIAGEELTTAHMAQFNLENPDMPGVMYQSWTGVVGKEFLHPMWKVMAYVIEKREGLNDGLVSVSSAKWGDFRGVVSCDGSMLVSHADIIGMHLVSGEFCFDAPAFYRDLVAELKMRGF